MLLFWSDFLVTLIKMLQIPLGVVPHQNFSGAGEEINGISGWTLGSITKADRPLEPLDLSV